MSYSAPDQSDALIEHLRSKGYEMHFGNGYTTGKPGDELAEPDNEDDAEDEYSEDIDGYWFTLSVPGWDIEVGTTAHDELAAWSYAMDHYFDNTEFKKGSPKR